MRNYFIFLLAILFGQMQCYGQTIETSKLSINDIADYEFKQNSVLKDSTISFGILKSPHNDLNSLIQTRVWLYKRPDNNFELPLHVWYHFEPETNETKGIRYQWGLYNPDFNPTENIALLTQLTKKEKAFRKKYDSLRKTLENRFGKPMKSEVISDHAVSYIENIFWEDDEKIIGLSIKFNRQLKEIPGIGVIGDFNIAVMITFK